MTLAADLPLGGVVIGLCAAAFVGLVLVVEPTPLDWWRRRQKRRDGSSSSSDS